MTDTHRTEDPKSVAADIARELRENPDHWFQGHLVKYADGTTADDGPMKVGVCWCLEGHILKRTGYDAADIVYRAFREQIKQDNIFRWNDDPDRSVQDVIELCEKVSA